MQKWCKHFFPSFSKNIPDSMWRSRWSFRVKRFGHCWQAKAFAVVLSSSCLANMCARKWCFCENFCPHWTQSKGRTFSWTAETCFCKWSFRVNLFWHTSHCQFLRFSFFSFPSLPRVMPPLVMMAWLVMASPSETPLYLYSQCKVGGLVFPFFLALAPSSCTLEMWLCNAMMLP